MKNGKILLGLVFLCGTMLASASAQLVHLAFRDFDGTFIFRADSGLLPWDHTNGEISRLDIFYDPTADLSVSPLDPAKNVWRALVTSPLGNFTITRPIQSLGALENAVEFQYYSVDPLPYGILDFSVHYDPRTLDLALPVPPLVLGYSSISLSGGRDFFDIPHLGEGYGYGTFNYAQAEWASAVDFSPVPEPSTYGLCAVGLLTGLVVWKRLSPQTQRMINGAF